MLQVQFFSEICELRARHVRLYLHVLYMHEIDILCKHTLTCQMSKLQTILRNSGSPSQRALSTLASEILM